VLVFVCVSDLPEAFARLAGQEGHDERDVNSSGHTAPGPKTFAISMPKLA
jgi:hypothetical protein